MRNQPDVHTCIIGNGYLCAVSSYGSVEVSSRYTPNAPIDIEAVALVLGTRRDAGSAINSEFGIQGNLR